jgi:hypothetical protein
MCGCKEISGESIAEIDGGIHDGGIRGAWTDGFVPICVGRVYI